MAKILCVDDEAPALAILEDVLVQAGHRPVPVQSAEEALDVLERGGVDLVVSDYQMPGMDGLELLAELGERQIDVPLIVVTGYGGIEHAVRCIKAGAADYITKPIRPRQLELAVDQALEYHRLRRENARYRQELNRLKGAREIVGESAAIQRILETLSLVAPTRTTVLLQGESGTGKELLARTLHALSDRSEGPFVSINCAALPENLVESTLFGHEKGAFTGASSQVKGAFERAHRGTLLLDEISEMRLDLQAKLLRVLQEQEFERVGGSGPIRVDVRIVATTNRALEDEVRDGRFREDLYYRLSVVPLRVPPLRERLEDIPLLVRHFADLYGHEVGREIEAIEPGVFDLLQGYTWPGNVRELAHAVQRAAILSPDGVLRPDVFEAERFGLTAASAPIDEGGTARGGSSVGTRADGEEGIAVYVPTLDIKAAEEALIARALEETGNNRTRAAELLGISIRTLRNRLNG